MHKNQPQRFIFFEITSQIDAAMEQSILKFNLRRTLEILGKETEIIRLENSISVFEILFPRKPKNPI